MSTPVKHLTRSKLPASIVAVQVKRRFQPVVVTAGHQQKQQPVIGEQFLMNWLDEQEEQEKQNVLHRLFIHRLIDDLPDSQAAGEKAKA